ncbi:replicative DNA helicase [Luteococcus sanguinis]|uniref:Replicative DNA helicase n=1 Tax=Luteococcus sanguinis TaxID=174038 RepID=A0ABW1X4X5_9ACTN
MGQAPAGIDRTPPQDLAAEQSVLGAMLMSKDAIADVVEVVKGRDFYRPAHELIYDAMLDLYGRGEPVDPITVADELGKRGELERVGGALYLHDLLASVAVAANAGYYSEIVRDKAVLRRLVEASIKVSQLGYQGQGDVTDIVDAAQQAIYEVSEGKTSEDYTPLSQLIEPTIDEMEAIGNRGGLMSGVPTGFAELDELTNGLHPGQMIIIAARPAMGKSTLALDFARAAAIKHHLTTAFFSLEMSKTEIVMRLLSAEAQVALNHIRGGKMTEEDWSRVVRKTAQVSEAPFYIDDSPNLTMMEIRAKARRLKQRNDLKLVIIDYMQLMTSGKKVESRQLEVSEFSRQIKLLAKELELPVIALSQLNRGPEQRTDKKPMLSDLRESGCLTAGTRVLRADTGAEITMGELLAGAERNIPVWSLDENHRLVPATMTHAFPSGTKPVFRLTLTSGRVIDATANHPFLTWEGWMPLGELVEGTRLATPRTSPEPIQPQTMDEDEVVLLGHLIGDGSFVRRQPIRYASIDEHNLAAVSAAAKRRFGITGIRDEYAAARVTTLRLPAGYRLTHGRRNPIAAWLDELGLFGLQSHEKFVPERVFRAPNEQVALFLHHLWATDGSVRWDDRAGQGRIYYASTSRRLVDDVARLLLRFGIVARIKTVKQGAHRDGYHLIINGVDQQRTFCEQIGVHGDRGAKCDEVYLALTNVKAKTMSIQFCGSTPWKHAPSWQRLAGVATLLEDEHLQAHATSDVYWDAVKSIEPIGEQEVYDATVLGTHNFIADGIIVHNSLEQDADMVILLNREDVYDRDSSRAGEADLIVAKHRNGPTATIVTAFQGHYSRFVDMQH